MGIKMLKRFGLSLIVVFFGFNASVSAQTASITLSDDSAQASYGFLVGGSDYGRTELKTEFLYNSDKTYLLDASLQVFDEVGSKMKGLVAGLGAKLYGGSTEIGVSNEKREMLVLGIGGMLRYALPPNPRLILGVDGYYAPKIVSFIDAERFYETAARIQYELLPKASAYVEYRKFYFKSEKDNSTGYILEDGFRAGMELTF